MRWPRVHGVPLVRLLGGAEKPLRPYGAVGYDGVEGCAKTAEGWVTVIVTATVNARKTEARWSFNIGSNEAPK